MSPLMTSLFWLVSAVILGAVEAFTVDLVAIWFALGAIGAMLISFLKVSFAIQLIVFFSVSIISLIVMKPFCKKVLKTRKVSTNADTTIGMVGTVTEAIEGTGADGRVFVNGLSWKASSTDGSPIEKDEKVIVRAIKGVTVEVDKL